MLPNTQVNSPVNRNRRLRPISPQDSSATTGLNSNPNGTYVANPYPTTAAAGYQGIYGQMLPSTNVQTPQQMDMQMRQQAQQQNFALLTNPVTSVFKRLTGLAPFYGSQIPNTSGSPDERSSPTGLNTTPTGQGDYSPNSHVRQSNGSPASQVSGGSFSQDAAMQGVLQRLDMGDMSALSQIPKADLEAMGLGDLAATVGAGGGSGENTDFQKTAAYQFNLANGVPLENQLRWDAKKKKYISVGKWMRQEKFNQHGKRIYGRRGGGGNAAPGSPSAADENYHGTINQIGVVNFNTSTG